MRNNNSKSIQISDATHDALRSAANLKGEAMTSFIHRCAVAELEKQAGLTDDIYIPQGFTIEYDIRGRLIICAFSHPQFRRSQLDGRELCVVARHLLSPCGDLYLSNVWHRSTGKEAAILQVQRRGSGVRLFVDGSCISMTVAEATALARSMFAVVKKAENELPTAH